MILAIGEFMYDDDEFVDVIENLDNDEIFKNVGDKTDLNLYLVALFICDKLPEDLNEFTFKGKKYDLGEELIDAL